MPVDLKTPATSFSRDLKANVTSGLCWSAAGRVVQQIIQFGISVVLARLLSPKEYGLMAMAMVFTGFAGMLAEAGFNTAIVQRKELKETHTHTVFWMTFGSGLALTALTFVLSPWLAEFFKAPSLKPIFRVISLNFIFGGIGNVPSALLQRQMQFRTIAQIDICSLLLSGIVGIVMALESAGVWSLVAQSISASLLTGLFRCISCRWHPKAIFCRSALSEIWSFSGYLYGFNFINYWARNADNLLVGKYFGAPALGVYNRAYALMLLPVTQINSVISQVIFPAFSSIQDDKKRVKGIYLRAIGVVALLAFPIMLGMFVTARPFVETLYGAKWLNVVPILQILALVGAMQVLINSTGWLFFSQGRTDVLFRWGVCLATLTISSFVVGVMLGSVRAMAYCYAIANLVFVVPGLAVAGRIVDIKLNELFAAVSGPLFISFFMAGVVAAVHLVLPPQWPAWRTLGVLVGTGMTFYAAIVHFFMLSAWKELMQAIQANLGISLKQKPTRHLQHLHQ
jgi:PST family polysaccharide transporter